jgi:hypothetical protein
MQPITRSCATKAENNIVENFFISKTPIRVKRDSGVRRRNPFTLKKKTGCRELIRANGHLF